MSVAVSFSCILNKIRLHVRFKETRNDVLIKTAQVLAQKILYGGNVIFFYYIPNREMINYSHVPVNAFTNISQKCQVKVSHKHHQQKFILCWGGCLCILSSKWCWVKPSENFDHDLLQPSTIITYF